MRLASARPGWRSTGRWQAALCLVVGLCGSHPSGTPASDPAEAERLEAGAQAALESRLYARAGGLFRDAWKAAPERPELGLKAAAAFAKVEEYPSAAQLLRDLCQVPVPAVAEQAREFLDGMRPDLDALYAEALADAKRAEGASDPAEALAAYELAGRIDPESPHPDRQRARVMAQKGDPAGALAALRSAIRKGYSDRDEMVEGETYAALHAEPEYAELVRDVFGRRSEAALARRVADRAAARAEAEKAAAAARAKAEREAAEAKARAQAEARARAEAAQAEARAREAEVRTREEAEARRKAEEADRLARAEAERLAREKTSRPDPAEAARVRAAKARAALSDAKAAAGAARQEVQAGLPVEQFALHPELAEAHASLYRAEHEAASHQVEAATASFRLAERLYRAFGTGTGAAGVEAPSKGGKPGREAEILPGDAGLGEIASPAPEGGPPRPEPAPASPQEPRPEAGAAPGAAPASAETRVSGSSFLHDAALLGDLDALRLGLARGESLLSKNEAGRTPLLEALSARQVAAARLLIDPPQDQGMARISLLVADPQDQTALHLASGLDAGLTALLATQKTLLEKRRKPDGATALLVALKERQGGAAEALLRAGADPGVVLADGQGAVDLAVGGELWSMVPDLIAKKASLGSPATAAAALGHAARTGDRALAALFRPVKAALDVEDGEGRTALDRAAGSGHQGLVEDLIEYGADPSGIGRALPGLHAAAGAGHARTVQLLLDRGVSTGTRAKNRSSALHHAAAAGRLEIVRLLLERNSPDSLDDEEGRTPLHRAAAAGEVAVVETLLAMRPDIDLSVRDRSGATPARLAQQGRHNAIYDLLERERKRRERR